MTLGKFKKIVVWCSQGVSGGPELLHQLVHELRGNGHEANICYWPFGEKYSRPEAYGLYDAPQTTWVDTRDSLFILPEVAAKFALKIRKGRVAIWWLSVDNYYGTTESGALRSLPILLKTVAKGAFVLAFLRGRLHLCQSSYAKRHISRYGIRALMLGDYINRDYLDRARRSTRTSKENIILYNPKKGLGVARKLFVSCPDLTFVPIGNLSREGVIELMSRAKLYMDFGHHPGRDRMPREAVIAGCCVVTGRRGSARNTDDIPIPGHYKMNERARDFVERFRSVTLDVFANYSERVHDFDKYREIVFSEPARFAEDVKRIFGSSRIGGRAGKSEFRGDVGK